MRYKKICRCEKFIAISVIAKKSREDEKFDLKRYFDIMTKDEKDIEKSQYKNNDVPLERAH